MTVRCARPYFKKAGVTGSEYGNTLNGVNAAPKARSGWLLHRSFGFALNVQCGLQGRTWASMLVIPTLGQSWWMVGGRDDRVVCHSLVHIASLYLGNKNIDVVHQC